MKERPIIFSAEMAQAIAEGKKTQTRRVMKPQPDNDKMRWNGERWEMYMGCPLGHDVPPCPFCGGGGVFQAGGGARYVMHGQRKAGRELAAKLRALGVELPEA